MIVMKMYSRQIAGSSSLPSLQSASPSHFQDSWIQRPFDLHLNSSSPHSNAQLASSLLSPQSSAPSQTATLGLQFLFAHWNTLGRQRRVGQLVGSSVPSLQSFSPSHLGKIVSALVYTIYLTLKRPRVFLAT